MRSFAFPTLPLKQTNSTLLQALQQFGYKGWIALTAHHVRDAEMLYAQGAHLVLMPFVDAAREAADSLIADEEKGSHKSEVENVTGS